MVCHVGTEEETLTYAGLLCSEPPLARAYMGDGPRGAMLSRISDDVAYSGEVLGHRCFS